MLRLPRVLLNPHSFFSLPTQTGEKSIFVQVGEPESGRPTALYKWAVAADGRLGGMKIQGCQIFRFFKKRGI